MSNLKSKRFVVRKSLIGKNQIIEVTFKNGKIDQFINQIDLKHLVLETDSPYLAPTPYRGKRNESAYITEIVDKLTTIYGLSFDEIASITTQNSKDVFGI